MVLCPPFPSRMLLNNKFSFFIIKIGLNEMMGLLDGRYFVFRLGKNQNQNTGNFISASIKKKKKAIKLLWVVSPEKNDKSLNLQDLRFYLLWKWGLCRSNQIKMQSLGWVLTQSVCVFVKRGNLDTCRHV